jgi:hypothetical protein
MTGVGFNLPEGNHRVLAVWHNHWASQLSYFGIIVKLAYWLCRMPKTIFSAGQEKLQRLLKSAREEAALTQTALAEKLKRPQSFVSKYESGERRLDLVELKEVCKSLGTSLIDLVKKFEDP